MKAQYAYINFNGRKSTLKHFLIGNITRKFRQIKKGTKERHEIGCDII